MSRLRANQITNENANGAPNFPHGLTVTGIVTATTTSTTLPQIVVGSAVTANSQGIDVTGIVTATSFKGAATNLTSIPAANLTGTAAAINGSNITNLNASNVSSGIVTSARLGGGTASATTFLNGHGSFATAGAWEKIASGSGPNATSFSIDNIFSADYQYYKLFYSWAQDDWMKMRYIKADGSIESGSVYVGSGSYTKENSAGGPSRIGFTNQNYGYYNYWNSADDCPSLCEVTYVNPYASNLETIDWSWATQVHVSQMYQQIFSNCNMNAYSVRGVQLFGSGGDSISSTNFKYLVLGAKI